MGLDVSFPLSTVPLLLRDSPVLAYGSFGGRQNRQIKLQCTSVTVVSHTSATVTATVVDGYLPIETGDIVNFGNIQGDDDLSMSGFVIADVVSQDFTTGVVVFTVDVDTVTAGPIAGVAFVQPQAAATAAGNFEVFAVQEGCKGISYDAAGLSSQTLQLEGALNVDGPWGNIGDGLAADGAAVASLPSGVRFVRLVLSAGSIVSWLSAF